MYIWISCIFGYHGYQVINSSWISSHQLIMDIRSSTHHGYPVIMDIDSSWLFKYLGYSDIMDIHISWIFKYQGYSDILNLNFPRNMTMKYLKHGHCRVVLPTFTLEALALQVPRGHILIFLKIYFMLVASLCLYDSPSLWGQCRFVCALSPVAPQISHLWLKRIGHKILSPLRRTCVRYTSGLSPVKRNILTLDDIHSLFLRAIFFTEAHHCSYKIHNESAPASWGIWKGWSTDQSQPCASVLHISKVPGGKMTLLGMGSLYLSSLQCPAKKAFLRLRELAPKQGEITQLRKSFFQIPGEWNTPPAWLAWGWWWWWYATTGWRKIRELGHP